MDDLVDRSLIIMLNWTAPEMTVTGITEFVTSRFNEAYDLYQWYLSVADDRVKDWFMMDGYTSTIVLSIVYVISVWFIGPRLMENRKPFNLKLHLIVYNIVIIYINFHIFSELLIASTNLNYSYSCQPVQYTHDPNEMRIARALWWFYFSKVIEMLDTVFFVLRKKNNQLTYLHVYHHSAIFIGSWVGMKWVAGGQAFFCAMMNSFIHILMYFYYELSAMGPKVRKYLWWKHYLTLIQLTQFYIGIIYGIQAIVIGCNFPQWMLYVCVIYGFTILILFHNFYYQTYQKPKKESMACISTGNEKNGELQNGHVYCDSLTTNYHIESKKKQ
ncbi:hypothetical protein ScPMuIL_016360 [Solemya velum]